MKITPNAIGVKPEPSTCPHCGGHLGWVYNIPPEGISITNGVPLPLGVTAAAAVQVSSPTPARPITVVADVESALFASWSK